MKNIKIRFVAAFLALCTSISFVALQVFADEPASSSEAAAEVALPEEKEIAYAESQLVNLAPTLTNGIGYFDISLKDIDNKNEIKNMVLCSDGTHTYSKYSDNNTNWVMLNDGQFLYVMEYSASNDEFTISWQESKAIKFCSATEAATKFDFNKFFTDIYAAVVPAEKNVVSVKSGKGEYEGEQYDTETFICDGMNRVYYFKDGELKYMFQSGGIAGIFNKFTTEIEEGLFNIPDGFQIIELEEYIKSKL